MGTLCRAASFLYNEMATVLERFKLQYLIAWMLEFKMTSLDSELFKLPVDICSPPEFDSDFWIWRLSHLLL